MISRRSTNAAGQYELEELDRSLKQCLSQWFSGGFLQLEQLTWQSSCDILEKVCTLEIRFFIKFCPIEYLGFCEFQKLWTLHTSGNVLMCFHTM